MTETYTLKPDREFLHRILDEGGDDLKKCFQCATCSTVCELSSGGVPFPRKEMIWAQWGLKDRLVADPDIWLCHQCNDCSTRCPRGARPGDVLAAVRQETVEHYAVPQLLGRCANRVKTLPLMLLAPAVLLMAALLVRDPIWGLAGGLLQFFHHEGFYSDLYPHWLLIGFYTLFWSLAMLGALVGVVRFWQAMKAADEASGETAPKLGFVPSIVNVLKVLLSHSKFSECGAQASRRLAHLGAFYGFTALFLVSVWAVIALYMINPFIPGHERDLIYPFALWNPWKLLANFGAAALIAGCVVAIANRLSGTKEAGASTSFDWIFVWLLLAVGATGLATEMLRFVADRGLYGAAHTEWSGLDWVAYTVYFVHLVLVFDLLVYMPYSKFAHIVYRTAALVYAERSGRSQRGHR